jgi:hypothetical protein
MLAPHQVVRAWQTVKDLDVWSDIPITDLNWKPGRARKNWLPSADDHQLIVARTTLEKQAGLSIGARAKQLGVEHRI